MGTLKISFDFDNTLSELPMQNLAKKYIKLGADVFVTTSRPDNIQGIKVKNDDLFKVTDHLGIDRKNITFTGYQDKFLYVLNYDIHFDDDEGEIFLINEYPTGICTGFLYEKNYKREQKMVNW